MSHEDNLQRLRDANPVPSPAGYPEREMGDRIADARGRAEQALLAPQLPGQRDHRGWRLPAIAASIVVVAFAVVGGVLLGRSGDSGPSAGPGASPVTCRVSNAGGPHAISRREARAEKVIAFRVHQLGGKADEFADSSSGAVGFAPRGISAAAAARACRAPTATIRPLVTRPVARDSSGPESADPLSDLSFRVPADEAAYSRLSDAQQNQLATAMSHYDCSRASAVLECDGAGTSSDGGSVYLLARPIVSGPDIVSATPLGPDSSGYQPRWSVDLQLAPAAARRVEAFTARFHTADQAARSATCNPTVGYPCRDFLAVSVGRSVRLAPQTEAVLSSSFSLTGRFSRNPAMNLATDLTGAAISLRSG